MSYKYITPETLSEFVNFYRDRDKKDWIYTAGKESTMQAKQAEGAAFVFNLLNDGKIALLADEVGMGKTIQALAVIAAFWRQKPDAKILVLAPRAEIALNWINEYGTFINVHYKCNDDIIKTSIGEEPVNPAIYCENLYELVRKVKQGWGKLFIGKISSFSYLTGSEQTNKRLRELGIDPAIDYDDEGIDEMKKTEHLAKQLKEEIFKSFSSHTESPFDLLIIDEAHYFRNINGNSFRVTSAKSFFGDNANKLAKKVLLLTATPNHTSHDDIKNIVSYFDKNLSLKEYQEILDKISLRRYRRLSSKGWMKYQYREEKPVPADFEDDIMSELFFGLYQKQLAENYLKGKEKKKNILGYLEGTEFIPHDEAKPQNTAETEQLNGKDFSQGNDTQLLIPLARKYDDIFKEFPSHPKYNKLIEEIVPENFDASFLNEKSLVFVRRIPSVREIAGRAILKYDEIFLSKISKVLNKKFELKDIGDRRRFNRKLNKILGIKDIEEDDPDEELDEMANTEGQRVLVPGSKALDLFKRQNKAPKTIASTHASNFRTRFSKSKPSIFSIFFAPSANYSTNTEQEGYTYKLNSIKQTDRGLKGYVNDYYITFLLYRLDRISESEAFRIKNYLGGRRIGNTSKEAEYTQEVETLFTIYWRFLTDTDKISEARKTQIRNAYNTFNYYQKEALSKFIEKGVLLASSAIIDLYTYYLKIQKSKDYQSSQLYNEFIKEVRKNFDRSSLFDLMNESISNFSVLCEKVFNLKSDQEIINYEWKDFFDAQPAYAYSGDTKNRRVLQSFNTPFFPDILISTSVLQEGVNLQYFCDKIIHYGIAWTPGDNEQRVGRIDRMFSKIEKKIEASDNARLHIEYPYLKNTIDQDQLVNFIYHKYSEENLIDHCQPSSTKLELDYLDMNKENWNEYFRKPEPLNSIYSDPFPVRDCYHNGSNIFYSFEDKPGKNDLAEKIINTFKQEKLEVFNPIHKENNSTKSVEICIVNKLFGNGRSQPVFVELNYNPLLSGLVQETVYVLSMRTPLSTKKAVGKVEAAYYLFRDMYEKEYLTVKLCLDPDQSNSSRFGVYMKTELPIFITEPDNPLSNYEVISSLNDLVECADHIEEKVFPKQDISLKDLSIEGAELESTKNGQLRSENHSISVPENWKKSGEFIFLKNEVDSNSMGNLKETFIENHKSSFSKFYIDSNNRHCHIMAYKSADVQNIERILLERLFEYYNDNRKLSSF